MVKNRTQEQNVLLDLLVILIEKFEDEHYQQCLNSSLYSFTSDGSTGFEAIRFGILGSRALPQKSSTERGISKAQAKALESSFTYLLHFF